MNIKKQRPWQHPISATPALKQRVKIQSALKTVWGGTTLWLSLGTTPFIPGAFAQVPAAVTPPIPSVIAGLIKQIDGAASRKDLETTLKFYSPNFTNSDGLNFKTQQQALKTFWQDTKSIQYQTQINRWSTAPQNRYVLETTTTINGVYKAADRDMNLSATVRSRLVIADQTILSQTVLTEQSRLSAGDKPPNVNVTLPEQVNVGQPFSFDAVVKEPLGDDLLLGSALEESITPERYLQPTVITLEPLSAGGIFKTGQAPQQPTQKWISAVLIKNGGITIVSQRLNVVRPNGSPTPTPR